MTLAVAEVLSPNKPNLDMTLAVDETLSPNKPNLDMTLAVAEALSPDKPNLDMILAVAEALNPNKPTFSFDPKNTGIVRLFSLFFYSQQWSWHLGRLIVCRISSIVL